MHPVIVLQDVRFLGHCGVTSVERETSQPLIVDLELECEKNSAAASDNLDETVDYAKVIQRVVELGTQTKFSLLEAFADYLSQHLLNEFSLSQLTLWIRKSDPPLRETIGSVGVRVTHRPEDYLPRESLPGLSEAPASFLIEQESRLPKGKILDVATGHGRNALYLASKGYDVVGIDRNQVALTSIDKAAKELHLPNLRVQSVDLEDPSLSPPDLGCEEYDAILVFFYLHRPLFPAIIQALKPGGVLFYETFLIDNHLLHHHPRRREFCLQPNELFQLSHGVRIMYYAEGEHQGPQEETPAITARMVGLKEQSSSVTHDGAN